MFYPGRSKYLKTVGSSTKSFFVVFSRALGLLLFYLSSTSSSCNESSSSSPTKNRATTKLVRFVNCTIFLKNVDNSFPFFRRTIFPLCVRWLCFYLTVSKSFRLFLTGVPKWVYAIKMSSLLVVLVGPKCFMSCNSISIVFFFCVFQKTPYSKHM